MEANKVPSNTYSHRLLTYTQIRLHNQELILKLFLSNAPRMYRLMAQLVSTKDIDMSRDVCTFRVFSYSTNIVGT